MEEPELISKSLISNKKLTKADLMDLTPGFSDMKKHDKCKADGTEYSPLCKKTLSKAEVDLMIDRLYSKYKMYKERQERRRIEHQNEIFETHTFNPCILENSKLIISNLSKKHINDSEKAKYLPIYKGQRLKEIENHKKLKYQKIKEEQQKIEERNKMEEDIILNIVAKKTDSSKYNEIEFLENVESNFKAYLHQKEQNKIKLDSKFSDITFHPNISKKSQDILKKKSGTKTFRERQKEYQERNTENKQMLKKQSECSFKPQINKKSKMMNKQLKSNLSQQKFLVKSCVTPDGYNTEETATDPVKCQLNYETDEKSDKVFSYTNKIICDNDSEIKEISEFISKSRPANEYQMNSQAIMDMIFLKTDKIQNELQHFRSTKELNDREERENLNAMKVKQKSYNRDREHEDINDRESDDESENYDDDQDGNILEVNNVDMQEYLQNGLNHPMKEETKGMFDSPEHTRNHNTNGPLETVGEATIEETTKHDLTSEEKLQNSLDKDQKNDLSHSKNSSKILKEYNSYMRSEQDSGTLEPDGLIIAKSKKVDHSAMLDVNPSRNSPRKSKEILGIGSLELLDSVLKQFKHCVK
jgi:hypothetical protein